MKISISCSPHCFSKLSWSMFRDFWTAATLLKIIDFLLLFFSLSASPQQHGAARWRRKLGSTGLRCRRGPRLPSSLPPTSRSWLTPRRSAWWSSISMAASTGSAYMTSWTSSQTMTPWCRRWWSAPATRRTLRSRSSRSSWGRSG